MLGGDRQLLHASMRLCDSQFFCRRVPSRGCWHLSASPLLARVAPRLMLPLDLSYDHRVIDGAEAARVTAFVVSALEDSRRLLL